MNHLARRDEARFTGDEDDPAPVPLQHAREIRPGQPSAAQHVNLKVAAPVRVGYRREVLDLVNPEIVDKDVHSRRCTHQDGGAFLCRGVSEYDAATVAAGFANAADRPVELCLVAAGDDHRGAFDGKLAGDLEADAGGRAGDEGGFVVQLQIHDGVSFCCATPVGASDLPGSG